MMNTAKFFALHWMATWRVLTLPKLISCIKITLKIFSFLKVDEFSKIINFSSSEQKVSGYYQYDLDSLSKDSWKIFM